MGAGPTTVEAARREALALLARTLTDAGVDFFVVPTYIGEPYRLGVLATSRAAALAAVRSSGGGWKARRQGPGRPGTAVPVADLTDDGQAALVVFRPRSWPDSSFRFAAGAGVTLEFWVPTEDGWDAPLRNPVSCLIPLSGQSPATVSVAGASYRTVAALTDRPWDDIDVPIDVVYTWVDGADPEWVARRDERLAALGGPATVRREACDEIRFADHGELRYSLRSLEQFAPWVRTVYLVTAGQRPDWLVDGHPRLRVVDHRDILEPDALPTFNSLAIETGLHRIDGLSDSYLYFNDDVFAGRSVTPRQFFLRPDVHRFYPQMRATLDPGPRTDDDPPF
ncbi:MAG TPA: stealth family protein, partial [Mycobacteriales bacterium]|nr:stealth family protein [Mycobacteriales bacterium]